MSIYSNKRLKSISAQGHHQSTATPTKVSFRSLQFLYATKWGKFLDGTHKNE